MAKLPSASRSEPTVAQLTASFAEERRVGRGWHSQFYLWLRRHHDAMAEALDRAEPSWATVAAAMAEHGLGQPPSPNGVCQVWYRVRLEVAAKRERHQQRGQYPPDVTPILPSPAGITEPLPGDRIPARSVAVETDLDNVSAPSFKLVTLRGMGETAERPLAGPASFWSARQAPAPRAAVDVDAVLATFLERPTLGAARHKTVGQELDQDGP